MAKVGGARKATNVLAITGGYAKNPGRLAAQRGNEPKPVGEIGQAPESFSQEERSMWDELVQTAHAGTLCAADRLFMEFAVRIALQVRAMLMAGEFNASLCARYTVILQKLGITPADRSRVSVVQPNEKEDPYAEFG